MNKPERERAAEIVRDAGGSIVGRTRLQKVAYLMELVGLGVGFEFEYRHYGPYSEDLAEAIQLAKAFNLVEEDEYQTNWGGCYSIFKVTKDLGTPTDAVRAAFAKKAAAIDAVQLELAATAAYLASAVESQDPWAQTAELKPEKAAGGRLDQAKAAYRELQTLNTPRRLPPIA